LRRNVSQSALSPEGLPGFFKDADRASAKGQRRYLFWNELRLWAAVVGSTSSVLTFANVGFDWAGMFALTGFVVALAAELVLTLIQPERDWYSGRAVAESTKTLAWRYAVKGIPFGDDTPDSELAAIFRDRVKSVKANGSDRVIISSDQPLITEDMKALRRESFPARKAAYIQGRTTDQMNWYGRKAQYNKRHAELLRVILIIGEAVAIALTAFKISGALQVDASGVLAALISSLAAWLGLKQYSQLASAYTVASSELAIQRDVLEGATEEVWGQAVADAEGAISREHTMWLASRGERSTD
jgi:hypothetical protein